MDCDKEAGQSGLKALIDAFLGDGITVTGKAGTSALPSTGPEGANANDSNEKQHLAVGASSSSERSFLGIYANLLPAAPASSQWSDMLRLDCRAVDLGNACWE